MPVLSEYRTNKSHYDVRNLISAVAASLGGFLLLVTVLVIVVAPLLAVPIAYGFTDDPEKFDLFVEMLRITFPYLLLISMTALCSAILNSYGKFAVPAITQYLTHFMLVPARALYARAGAGTRLGCTYCRLCTIIFSVAFFTTDKSLSKPQT